MVLTHDEAFLADIAENPDDDASRLVYADWLDDHGEADRAELIRLQCAGDDSYRLRELIEEMHGPHPNNLRVDRPGIRGEFSERSDAWSIRPKFRKAVRRLMAASHCRPPTRSDSNSSNKSATVEWG